jgi:hypothetical protein
MQAIFTKITIGFLLLSLVVGTGLTFMITTANLNGLTPDAILTDNNIAQQSNAARLIVYSSKNASQSAGLDTTVTNEAQSKDSFSTADEQIKISTIVQSFFTDLSTIIPISSYTLKIFFAIIATLAVSVGIFLFLGRNP